MNCKRFASCVLFLSLAGAGSALGAINPADDGDHYTKSQLKQMMREAHTPEQYRVLAHYFGEQQKLYLQKAEDEKQEWTRLSQNTTSTAAKYPRPADSVRYQSEYDLAKASEAGDNALKYNQLVSIASTSKDQ